MDKNESGWISKREAMQAGILRHFDEYDLDNDGYWDLMDYWNYVDD